MDDASLVPLATARELVDLCALARGALRLVAVGSVSLRVEELENEGRPG